MNPAVSSRASGHIIPLLNDGIKNPKRFLQSFCPTYRTAACRQVRERRCTQSDAQPVPLRAKVDSRFGGGSLLSVCCLAMWGDKKYPIFLL